MTSARDHEAFLAALAREAGTSDPRVLADVLWLALRMPVAARLASDTQPLAPQHETPQPALPTSETPRPTVVEEPAASLHIPHASVPTRSRQVRVAVRASLPQARALSKALRPLGRSVASRHAWTLDELATTEQSAEQRSVRVVLEPARERWLDVALVLDRSATMVPWLGLARELSTLFLRHGAFRDVHTWSLWTNESVGVTRGLRTRDIGASLPLRSLVQPGGRRLVLLLTDAVHDVWREAKFAAEIAQWRKHMHVALLPVLPEALWSRTALGVAVALERAPSNHGTVWTRTRTGGMRRGSERVPSRAIAVPVASVSPEGLRGWSLALTHGGRVSGALLPGSARVVRANAEAISADEQVRRFLAQASPQAQRLATIAAAIPLSLGLLRTVLFESVKDGALWHLAELLASGLLRRVEETEGLEDDEQYEFRDEAVRDAFLKRADPVDVERAREHLSAFVSKGASRSVNAVAAYAALEGNDPGFARITDAALQRMGFAGLDALGLSPSPAIKAPMSEKTVGAGSAEQIENDSISDLDPHTSPPRLVFSKNSATKVYLIANELGLPNDTVIAKIRSLGFQVNNRQSKLAPAVAKLVRESLLRDNKQDWAEIEIAPGIRKRVRKPGTPKI